MPIPTDLQSPSSGPQRPEAALLEQREWLRATVACIGDALITADALGRVTSLNPAAQSLTGWSQAEAAGIPLEQVFKIVDDASRRPIEVPARRALREGALVGPTNHSLLISRDGTERLLEGTSAPIRDEGGAVAGVVLVLRDNTERMTQERRNREALDYAKAIIATLREPFIVLDGGLRVKMANASFYRTFRVPESETEGRSLYDLGDGQWDIPSLRALLAAVTKDVAVDDFEVEHDFPTIGPRSMLLNARRFPPEGVEPDLILLAIEDVTERKRSELVIKDSELRYRRLFQTAKDGILILDAATGTIIDANPFMSGLLGYEHDDFLGKELWEIGLFRDVTASRAAYRELREQGYIRYGNLPLKTKGGREVEVEFVSNVYEVDHRQVAQCNIRDLTEHSRLEKQAREQAAALADLHRRKDEFLAMLSHELRNPLSPILNAVHLLRLQGDEGLIQREARSVIERQVGQLARLIDDLLEVSRITGGKVRIRAQRLDLRGVAGRAVESARPLIEAHRHTLTVTLPEGPLWLHADPTRLEQVVVNLLNNAAKYTEDGGRIELGVDRDGDEAVLRVRDTGVGIARELLPRIFDLFTQADRSLDRSQGGLGIGLALVQRLVELHRGTVEVRSEGPGRGSEFVVRLPVLPAPATQAPAPPAEPDGRPANTGRVLVVDDNLDSAEMLAKLLRMSGHDVRTAYTGPAALEAATAQQPEVVLLDIGLPGINGYEVARRLRQIPHLGKVQIVAMTGYGQESDLRLAREAGFDSHLTKPVDFLRVENLLTTLMAQPGRDGIPSPGVLQEDGQAGQD